MKNRGRLVRENFPGLWFKREKKQKQSAPIQNSLTYELYWFPPLPGPRHDHVSPEHVMYEFKMI